MERHDAQTAQIQEVAPAARQPPTQVLHPNAVGIDLGAEDSWVAIPEDRDAQPVRKFGCFTEDLHALANWLAQCGIDTVAMESTGVYWVPLFQILESRGFRVFLVNARHVKNVPGRKSDVQDCQWLQRLYSFGLLAPSFRPEDQICVLRATGDTATTSSATPTRTCSTCRKPLS